MPRSVLVITDDSMLAHRNPPGHPERPARLQAVLERLDRGDLPIERAATRPAERAALQRVHAAAYLDRLEDLRDATAQLDPDTWVVPGSIDAAHRAAGGAMQAVEHAVATGGPAFALVRPPGHHAERDHAMGFCLYANVAVAVEHARHVLGAERVMILDYDVHHGNGTQRAFEERDDVLFVDAHRGDGFWPGSGAASERGRGAGTGFTVNVPYPAGTGDDFLVGRLGALVPERAAAFRPDLVIVSAGFDAHESDPLGGCRVTDDGFAALAGIARAAADAHAGGRIAFVLEGGYEPATIARCVARTIEELAADPAAP